MTEYIDKQVLLAEAKALAGPETGDGWDNWGVYALINRQPVADVRPNIHGKWIEETDRVNHWHCSECGYTIGLKFSSDNYCPQCGADNRER